MCCAVYAQLPCVVVALQEVYQAWPIKLDLDYMFLCPTCGDSPDVLTGDATSGSILGRYYNGTPIKEVDPLDDAEYHRPHTKAQRALFLAPSARKLLFSFATYVRGDHRTAFGHGSNVAAFSYEHDHTQTQHLC